MIDYIINIIKEIYSLSGKITPVVLPIGALILFVARGKIKLYFQKDLLKDQEEYKKELEIYKTILLRDLEEYKIGIDVRKHLSVEVSNKRLMAYQNVMEAISHFRNLSWLYNKKPDAENKMKIYGGDEEKAWEFIRAMESNMLFFSSGAMRQLKTQIAPVFQKIVSNISDIKPVDEDDLNNLSEGIKNVKKYLLSEIFPDDPFD